MGEGRRWAKLFCAECPFSWEGLGLEEAMAVGNLHVESLGHVVGYFDGEVFGLCGPACLRGELDRFMVAICAMSEAENAQRN